MNELTLILAVTHDTVEKWTFKVLWIQIFMQTNNFNCILLWEYIKEAFSGVCSCVDGCPEIVLHVVNTSLIVSYNSGSFVSLLLINLISQCVYLLDKQETLLDHIIRLNDLYKTLDVSILTIRIQVEEKEAFYVLEFSLLFYEVLKEFFILFTGNLKEIKEL